MAKREKVLDWCYLKVFYPLIINESLKPDFNDSARTTTYPRTVFKRWEWEEYLDVLEGQDYVLRFEDVEHVYVVTGPMQFVTFIMRPNKVAKCRHMLLCAHSVAQAVMFNPKRSGRTSNYWVRRMTSGHTFVGAYDIDHIYPNSPTYTNNDDAELKKYILEQARRYCYFVVDSINEGLKRTRLPK